MQLDTLAKQLINRYQSGFPLVSRPFLVLAQEFGVTEHQVVETMQQLEQNGVLSRLGAVCDHSRAGASTLAAISVPKHQLEQKAEIINRFTGVNHNYAREHDYNLWFVVTADSQSNLQQQLAEIEAAVDTPVLVLPMEKAYHIDLSFKIDFGHSPLELAYE